MKTLKAVVAKYNQTSLILRILIGLAVGSVLALVAPGAGWVGELGNLFVGALKGIAPVLVFVIVASALAQGSSKLDRRFGTVIWLYMLTTFLAAAIAVITSFMFPVKVVLADAAQSDVIPQGLGEVLSTLLTNFVANPVSALMNGNYIGILAWAIAMGVVLRHGTVATREVLNDAAKGVEFVVRLVIRFAPVGIFGLVANTFATTGAEVFIGYIQLLVVLLGSMFFVALVINPFLVWFCTHKNPFPVTLMTLRESGVAAFFTRSSAANIPVNLEICRRLGLPESTYSISIPVGATINMAGAAITITVLTLSAAYSLNIPVDLGTAVFLSFVASICACGASGVPGGSLMLIPLACGLFGIDQNTAMQVVAVGFIIGVLQDSCETALNSSSDALFTIAACQRAERLERGE